MKIEEEIGLKTSGKSAGVEETSRDSRSALIAGATGLVGGILLERLLQEDLYRDVRALVRRPVDLSHPKLTIVITDFDQLEEETEDLQVDDVFCCLGTTIKKAGSQAAFRKVDRDHVTTIARLTRAAGARRFLLVSSIGANAATSNFYLSVKGAAEEAVEACGFPEFHIFRPSLLTGSREEPRPGERVLNVAMRFVAPLLAGRLRRFRPVHARLLAMAMVEAAKAGSPGRKVYTFDEIDRLSTGR
ncbi:MAG: NAD(P)H-binding protein [bacterium]|nr:NAD(P)H-binding protein [bacterium]